MYIYSHKSPDFSKNKYKPNIVSTCLLAYPELALEMGKKDPPKILWAGEAISHALSHHLTYTLITTDNLELPFLASGYCMQRPYTLYRNLVLSLISTNAYTHPRQYTQPERGAY